MNLKKNALLILAALPVVLTTSIAPAVAQQNSFITSEAVSITVISEQEFARWDKYAKQALASKAVYECIPYPTCML
ncbi:MAG: hypothetical protein HRT35_19525 [Algicola sp.]|nr:hypothetical protein [Algicola sp.]